MSSSSTASTFVPNYEPHFSIIRVGADIAKSVLLVHAHKA